IRERLDLLTRVADLFGIDDFSFSSYASAITRLSARDCESRRSLTRFTLVERQLQDHLAAMAHEERLIESWIERLAAEQITGESTSAVESKREALLKKAKEQRKILEATVTDPPDVTFADLAALQAANARRAAAIKAKRAQVKAFKGLPPVRSLYSIYEESFSELSWAQNLDLARQQLKAARATQMELIQARERILVKMADGSLHRDIAPPREDVRPVDLATLYSASPVAQGLQVIVGTMSFLGNCSAKNMTRMEVATPAFRQVPADQLGILPVPSQTYVINLRHRQDRYEDMERLRMRLGVRWSYVVAEASDSPLVGRIMAQVRSIREERLGTEMDKFLSNTTFNLPFQWPPSSESDTSASAFEDAHLPPVSAAVPESEPLTCATENLTLWSYYPSIPEYRILSHSRIACWHSHLSAIRSALGHAPEKATLILEDDVDMEADIKARLLSVWGLLPPDWDMVFLGHCWSNESYYPAMATERGRGRMLAFTSHIHPSRAPLCTHAYALSPAGARRLVWHLTFPLFAYSRAIDHAFAWLIQSGRLKSYSIVPSVVVQRKMGKSDVMEGKGSAWRDTLVRGVLADDT
ncbi:hypothetical protein GGX14DRAFT_352107, partial [Mycena pura]